MCSWGRNRAFVLVCLLLGLVTGGCVEPVEIDPSGTDLVPVAVKCILTISETNEQRATVVYATLDENGAYVPVENAKVVLRDDDDGHILSEFWKVSPGEYKAVFKPERGKRYKLTVSVPGRDDLWATTEMVKVVMTHFCVMAYPSQWQSLRFGQELVEKSREFCSRSGYRFLPDNETGVYFTMGNVQRYLDDRVDRWGYNLWITSDFGARLWTNHLYADRSRMSRDKFDSRNFSVLYDTYGIDELQWIDGESLFDKAIRVRCPDDADAVFDKALFNVDRGILSDELIWYEWLSSGDYLDRVRSSFLVSGEFTYGKDSGNLIFYVVSDELDAYFKSVETYLSNQKTDLMEILYSDTDCIYSNVHNGQGIFGSCAVYKYDISEKDFLL